MKKRIISIILVNLFFLCLVSCGKNNDNQEKQEGTINISYDTYGSFWMRSHDFKTMPIAVFNALPTQQSDYSYNYLEHKETIQSYYEANINTLYSLYENAGMKEVETALDWCYEYGISYVVGIGSAEKLTPSSSNIHNLDRVKYYDAFGGVMTFDEPGRVSFENLASSINVLNEYMGNDILGSLWHINLFPNYATQKQLYNRVNSGTLPDEGYTYEKYVSDYMSIVKPKVLSYDYYPCRGEEGNQLDSYFQNMSIIRKYALSNNVPFWVYVQACKFGGNTRVPTEGDILWQINTALSYGCKGIQYFCGVTPLNGGGEVFVGSLFDRDGNKTEIYNYAKKANQQIKVIDEVLMCCKSKGVMITGDMPWGSENKIPLEDILTSYGELNNIEANHVITGCFEYNNKNAYYLTNNSSKESDEVKINFKTNIKGFYVHNGKKEIISNNSLAIKMEPGEGVLIVVE